MTQSIPAHPSQATTSSVALPAGKKMPATTQVIGFFNPNPYAVLIIDNSIGMQTLLQNKGDYITDASGNKVNDPRFEAYLHTLLAAEYSTTGEVDIRYAVRQERATATTVVGFSAGATPDEKPPASNTRATAPTTSVSRAPVAAMSVQDAIASGLMKRSAIIPEDVGIPDTGKSISQRIPDLITPSYDTIVPKVHAAPIKPVASAEAEELVVAPVAPILPPEFTFPEPDLGPDVAEPKKSAALPSAQPFTCPIDDVGFRYRSQLERYVTFKYPDKLAAIMSKYPKKQ